MISTITIYDAACDAYRCETHEEVIPDREPGESPKAAAIRQLEALGWYCQRPSVYRDGVSQFCPGHARDARFSDHATREINRREPGRALRY